MLIWLYCSFILLERSITCEKDWDIRYDYINYGYYAKFRSHL